MTELYDFDDTTSAPADIGILAPAALPATLPDIGGIPVSAVGDGVPAGRDPESGRFLPGNRFAAGNPLSERAGEIRATLYEICSRDELAAVLRKLIDRAKSGNLTAIKILLERLLGPPVALDVATRIEKLEILLEGTQP